MSDENGKRDKFTPDAEKFRVGEPLVIEAKAKALYGERFSEEKQKYVPVDEHGEEREQMVELQGEPVRVLSAPYVAQDGPNAGETVYPVKLSDEAGGAMVGVPEGRLRRAEGAGKVSISLSDLTDEQWNKIFGKPKPDSEEGTPS